MLIQVALPTDETTELDTMVSDIVTRVNSLHANLTHQPVVYLRHDVEYSQCLSLLTIADALIITNQREGMNLTAHDYIFCQDGLYSHKHFGSLIVSEFTGSSSVFGGHDLSVNPWDYRQFADAIRMALELSEYERETLEEAS